MEALEGDESIEAGTQSPKAVDWSRQSSSRRLKSESSTSIVEYFGIPCNFNVKNDLSCDNVGSSSTGLD